MTGFEQILLREIATLPESPPGGCTGIYPFSQSQSTG